MKFGFLNRIGTNLHLLVILYIVYGLSAPPVLFRRQHLFEIRVYLHCFHP